MKTLRKIRCWWSGHELLDYRSSGDCCARCGEWKWWHEWAGMKHRIRHWWLYHRPQILRRSYYAKCSDCGQRFNRHTNDCPPF